MKFYEGRCPTPFTFATLNNGTPPNMEFAARTMREDTKADLLWFKRHRGTRFRHRGPTVLEMVALSLPSTAKVTVELDANGKTWRHYRFTPVRKLGVGGSNSRTEKAK